MATGNQVDVGLSGSSGSGAFAGNVSPSFTTPVLGTPTSGTLTNCTGLPAAGIVGTSNGGIFYSNASTGAILAATATAQQLLMSGASTTPQWSTTTYPLTNAINTILYASSANVMGVVAAVNSAVMISSAGGVPSMSTTLPASIAATNMVLTTPNIGTPSAGTLTNCTGLPAAGLVGTSNGGIFYSTASNGAILAGTATAGQSLLSGASTTPQWTTTTYPTTNAINTIMYASSANILGSIAAVNSAVLVSSAGGVPSMSVTLPSGLTATNMTLITPAIGTPSAGVLTNCTGLPVAGIVGTSNGGIFYSNASTAAILAGTATSGQLLLSGASTTPQWSTTTYPVTNAINTIMYASSANVQAPITAANSGVLVTTSAGVPGWSGTMTNGQLIIGSTTATPVAATLTAGTGIIITNGAGSITIATDAEGTWVNQNSASVTMAIGTGYTINNGASLVTLTLPAAAVIGDYVEINGQSSGGWSIAQAAGQLIHIGNQVTTTGVGGSLASTNQYDCVRLRCIVTNTTWTVVSMQSAGLTYV